MCTAVTYRKKDFYFGRTLDMEFLYPQEVTITPRNFPLNFRNSISLKCHYAIIGMAYVLQGYPLYFDAINEKGLAVAGLNFVGNAVYKELRLQKDNITHFEFIPWILAQCGSVKDAAELIKNINITNIPFSEQLPLAELHWIIADHNESITVESVKDGICVYPNPVGVLTNNPPFNEQIFNLNNYMHLSAKQPKNNFSDKITLQQYSRGMGALGLPGDMSSQSRFVRVSFVKMNSVAGESEHECVSQFFNIMSSVNQINGACELADGIYEKTVYTSCCNAHKGIYYYTTYENHQITAVDMNNEDLNGDTLKTYPLIYKEQILFQN